MHDTTQIDRDPMCAAIELDRLRRILAAIATCHLEPESQTQTWARGLDLAIQALTIDISVLEAAGLLNVSPQYVKHVIEQGCLRYNYGSRLYLFDVIRFKREDDAKRSEALRQLTAESGE